MLASLLLPALMSTGSALAAVPVVHDGEDPSALVSRVTDRTGLPADQLRTVRLDEILDDPVQALGGGALRRCTGSATRGDQVRSELVRAEAAWTQDQAVAAMDHLDLAVAHLGCLSELVDPAAAARIFLLRGALEAHRGNADSATGELRTALSFQPDLSWDSRFPIEGEILLVEAQASTETHAVAVEPPGSSSGPWVDGRTVPGDGSGLEVSPGLHLAQHPSAQGIQSAWLTVAGDATIVLPGSYRRPVLEAIASPDSRSPVEQLLAATLAQAPAAYVSTMGGLWLVSFGDDGPSTEELVAPPPPPEEDDGKGKKKKKKKR